MSISSIPKRKGTTGNYFNKEVEDAIYEYIDEHNEIRRNILFSKKIYKPVKKIAEIYKNSIKTKYADEYFSKREMINDCITDIIIKTFPKLKQHKGKAYSYISVAAKNFYIQLNNKYYVAKKKITTSDNILIELKDDNIENNSYNQEFLKQYYTFIDWMWENIDNKKYVNLPSNIITAMRSVLVFMNSFDEVEQFYSLEANNVFRKKNPHIKQMYYVKAKDALNHLLDQWKKNWNGYNGGNPSIYKMTEIDKWKKRSRSYTKRDNNSKKGRISTKGRSVLVYKINGEFVGEWSKLKYAAQELNVHQGHACRVANGHIKQHKGYIFVYNKKEDE